MPRHHASIRKPVADYNFRSSTEKQKMGGVPPRLRRSMQHSVQTVRGQDTVRPAQQGFGIRAGNSFAHREFRGQYT